nr:atp-dependent dna helicase, chloroplastic [Quercus suber]
MDFKNWAQDNGIRPFILNVDDMEYEDCVISVVDGNFLSKVSDISKFSNFGKQYSKQLEETMEKFAQGEIKILICANIVESGLDIQNANTIIVQEVQQFGLAQLYQVQFVLLLKERLAALEECRELGQGFQLAERDMGIRGFGTIFGQQQTGDVGNVDLNINPHLPSEYINYLENPMEIINEAEKAAENEIWSLMQFTENLHRQYGKEPYSVELLLKKLYVRRMAADLGIKRIYASGKMVGMKTNMTKLVFKLITESMVSDVHRNSLVLEDDLIKAELLLELPRDQLTELRSVFKSKDSSLNI